MHHKIFICFKKGITFYLPVTFINETTNVTTNCSQNLFSTDANKLTYSFEKAYYTRSIEFSDYLRTEFKLEEPIVVYFLNDTGKKNETIIATLPIWLDQVPVSVSGTIYNAHYLKELIFTDNSIQCNQKEDCKKIKFCNSTLTCYLVDEHGIIVMSNINDTNEEIIGSPLYKINPWLMLQLELDELYDLIVPGNLLQGIENY